MWGSETLILHTINTQLSQSFPLRSIDPQFLLQNDQFSAMYIIRYDQVKMTLSSQQFEFTCILNYVRMYEVQRDKYISTYGRPRPWVERKHVIMPQRIKLAAIQKAVSLLLSISYCIAINYIHTCSLTPQTRLIIPALHIMVMHTYGPGTPFGSALPACHG